MYKEGSIGTERKEKPPRMNIRAYQQERAEDLSLVVQAGGESRRMGQPKASMRFLDHALIWQPVCRLLPLATELIITTNDPDSIKREFQEPRFAHIRYERDLRTERGALSGLFTALSVARKPYVALSACDMIFANPELFMYEYHIMKEGDFDLVVPLNSNGFEPFHAIYHRERCLEFVERALASGERKLTAWFSECKRYEVGRDEILRLKPQGNTFLNINTPEQLSFIEKRIKCGNLPHI